MRPTPIQTRRCSPRSARTGLVGAAVAGIILAGATMSGCDVVGAVLALGAAIMVWLGAYSAATGSMIVPSLVRLGSWRLVWGLVAGLLLAWAYKWITFVQ